MQVKVGGFVWKSYYTIGLSDRVFTQSIGQVLLSVSVIDGGLGAFLIEITFAATDSCSTSDVISSAVVCNLISE
ncbi:hypothetical protein [Moorena sp. SIO3I6]|uniref:hypothetical protein n=1 Tax=Moorena sp. SIO3I6 TaxID=2607831 RepID=UPI0013F85A61|nr:hypothetical protein [Moorena sp. SIO3I6]NEP23320.1 hypothetical protein [Moorena sp. SIO3I6]